MVNGQPISKMDYSFIDNWITEKIESPEPTQVNRILELNKIKRSVLRDEINIYDFDERLKLEYGTWKYLDGYLYYWSPFETGSINLSFGLVTEIGPDWIKVTNAYRINDEQLAKLKNYTYFISEYIDIDNSYFTSKKEPFIIKDFDSSQNKLYIEPVDKSKKITDFISLQDRISEAGTWVQPITDNMPTMNESNLLNLNLPEVLRNIARMESIVSRLEKSQFIPMDGDPYTNEPTPNNDLIVARAWLKIYNLQRDLVMELDSDPVNEERVTELRIQIYNILETTRKKSTTEQIMLQIISDFIIYKIGVFNIGFPYLTTLDGYNESNNRSTKALTNPLNCQVYENDKVLKNNFIIINPGSAEGALTDIQFTMELTEIFRLDMNILKNYDFSVNLSFSKLYGGAFFVPAARSNSHMWSIDYKRLSDDRNNPDYYRLRIYIKYCGVGTNIRNVQLGFSYYITAKKNNMI